MTDHIIPWLETYYLQSIYPATSTKIVWQDNSTIEEDKLIYIDGRFFCMVPAGTNYTFADLKTDASYRIDILPLSKMYGYDYRTAVNNAVIPISYGSRLLLTAEKVSLQDNPDFKSYLFFWDMGTEEEVNTLLAECIGVDTNTYITEKLTDGVTYRFCIAYSDKLGNISSMGTIYSGSVNAEPPPPEGIAGSYSQSTRSVSLTATEPETTTDIACYCVYSNFLPGHGLQNAIVTGQENSLKTFAVGDTIEFTSYELSDGLWMFAIASLDNSGLESLSEVLSFNLVTNGSNLVETGAKPNPPTILCTPLAGGIISITVDIPSTYSTDSILIYRDGVNTSTITVTDSADYFTILGDAYSLGYGYSATSFTITEGPLTNGTEYSYYAVSTNGSVLSDRSNIEVVVADSEAVAGSGVITIEVVK